MAARRSYYIQLSVALCGGQVVVLGANSFIQEKFAIGDVDLDVSVLFRGADVLPPGTSPCVCTEWDLLFSPYFPSLPLQTSSRHNSIFIIHSKWTHNITISCVMLLLSQ